MSEGTIAWQMTEQTWALYTENANLEEPALKAGLRQMGVYYGKDCRIKAKQFVGSREAVKAVAAMKVPFAPFGQRRKGEEQVGGSKMCKK